MLPSAAALLGISTLLLAGGGPAVAPPAQGGPWHQLGAAVTSRPGTLGHFFRSARSPASLAVVARSSSARPRRLTWVTYC